MEELKENELKDSEYLNNPQENTSLRWMKWKEQQRILECKSKYRHIEENLSWNEDRIERLNNSIQNSEEHQLEGRISILKDKWG